ncbi:MAG: M48 family metallopeptidase [Sphingorhabdus sp.]
MKTLFFLIAALLASAVLTAHAASRPNDVAAYRALVAQDLRLATTGYRLAKANAAFCKKRERNPGWVIHDIGQYPDEATAKSAFGFPRPLAIAAVVSGGPAAQAGLHAGDAFVSWNGEGYDWSETVGSKQAAFRVQGFSNNLTKAWLSRAGQKFTLISDQASDATVTTLAPSLVCASGFVISSGSKADAGADGRTVRVSAKLSEFAPGEDEFAAIVAHELAHNILEHRKQLDAARVKRGIGRMFGKSKKLIRQTEIEADRLSVWLMANAGYEPRGALRFIERYGRKYGHGFFSDGTHYRWKKRMEIMAAEIDVMDKTQAGWRGYFPPLLKEKQIGDADLMAAK